MNVIIMAQKKKASSLSRTDLTKQKFLSLSEGELEDGASPLDESGMVKNTCEAVICLLFQHLTADGFVNSVTSSWTFFQHERPRVFFFCLFFEVCKSQRRQGERCVKE